MQRTHGIKNAAQGDRAEVRLQHSRQICVLEHLDLIQVDLFEFQLRFVVFLVCAQRMVPCQTRVQLR